MDKNFEQLGEKIEALIDDAVNSQDYQKLSQNITQTIEKALNSGSNALMNAMDSAAESAYKRYRFHVPEEFRKKQASRENNDRILAEEKKPGLYQAVGKEQAKGILLMVLGITLAVVNGATFLAQGIVHAFLDYEHFLSPGSVEVLLLFLAGLFLTVGGKKKVSRVSRFRKYLQGLGKHTYAAVGELAKLVGKPINFVRKDLRTMINQGWFLEGHLDHEEKTLITSNETYEQYHQTELQKQEREKQEENQQKESEENGMDAQVREIIKKGEEYLQQIHACNDSIPGEEISGKIARLEMIVARIFDRAKNHPEIVPDLKKLMNYYLPMTIKLLNAYEEMDQQPVQGENIRKSKQEIEETLDTLNLAFEKLLDSVFKDTALDVSTDITVLETLLAQEGLTEDEF